MPTKPAIEAELESIIVDAAEMCTTNYQTLVDWTVIDEALVKMRATVAKVRVDPEALKLAEGVTNACLQGPVPLATVSAIASELIRLHEES